MAEQANVKNEAIDLTLSNANEDESKKIDEGVSKDQGNDISSLDTTDDNSNASNKQKDVVVAKKNKFEARARKFDVMKDDTSDWGELDLWAKPPPFKSKKVNSIAPSPGKKDDTCCIVDGPLVEGPDGTLIAAENSKDQENVDEDDEDEEEHKKQGFFASLWNMGCSLPGLIGTWCWPLLLAWMFMIAWYNVPVGLSMLFYALELAMMCVLVTNMWQYASWLNKYQRRIPDDNAVRLIGWSVPVNIAFPLVVCIIYIGGYGYPEYKMWTDGSFFPNTRFGIFMWIVKWVGFVMLTVGLVRITNLWKKTKKQWNDIRSGKAAARKAKQKKLEKEAKEAKKSSDIV